MDPQEYAEMRRAIERKVMAELPPEAHMVQGGPGIAGLGLGVMSIVPLAVRLALDTVVDLAGSAIEGLATAERDLIRTVVSEKVLEFTDRIIHGLEDKPK